MTKHRRYGILSLFCGLGGGTLGFLRARARDGSRFESVGAIDSSELACENFERVTGAQALALDIARLSPAALAGACTRRPDVVFLSPPCKGWSGCMPEATSRLPKYQELNALALYSLRIILDAWETPPALILLENVPRILSRGRVELAKAKVMLRERGYVVDLRTHCCGELGGLGQRRTRVLLVARHAELAPSHLLMPDPKPLRTAGEVLFDLPVPTPGSIEGGPLHALPKISGLNWLRLASIRAGKDWHDLPAAIRIGGPATQHAGKYGVGDPDRPAHTVIGQARTGKGWADIADPRLGERATRQNGGFGVNDQAQPAHGVLGEGTVRNTFSSVVDSRLGCSPRSGTMGVADSDAPASTVLGVADIHRGQAAVVDPRVPEQHRGNYGVEASDAAASTVRGTHVPRTAPASIADDRVFEPTHELFAGQASTSSREAWVGGRFELVGPHLDTPAGGRPIHAVILAPDGCVHRPMTDLELAALQGLPVWHRPGDPVELELGKPGGQWLELRGNKEQRREQIGNAVPPATAQAVAEQVLELLDGAGSRTFKLSSAGVWVAPRPVRIPRRALTATIGVTR